ncbi:MAG: hypothetical protein IT447_07275 [Phycisphaerales bacterium]|nr:hypothetical protein [Phycisphaerales bacterium]
MRTLSILFLLLAVGGCVANKKHPSTTNHVSLTRYETTSAAALVFEPPIAANLPHLDLSRDSRTPAAFVSYDSTFTSYYYVRTDDRLPGDWYGWPARRAITEKFGITYR